MRWKVHNPSTMFLTLWHRSMRAKRRKNAEGMEVARMKTLDSLVMVHCSMTGAVAGGELEHDAV